MDKQRQKVFVYIKGVQVSGEETDENIVETEGEIIEKDEKKYVLFSDEQSDTIMRISNDDIQVIKKGHTNSKMVFCNEKEDSFMYNTPYGAFLMSIVTKSIKIEKNSDEIRISIKYDLYTDHIFTAECNMDIFIKNIYQSSAINSLI